MPSTLGTLLWKHSISVRRNFGRTLFAVCFPMTLAILPYFAVKTFKVSVIPDCDYDPLPLLSSPAEIFLTEFGRAAEPLFATKYNCRSGRQESTLSVVFERKRRSIRRNARPQPKSIKAVMLDSIKCPVPKNDSLRNNANGSSGGDCSHDFSAEALQNAMCGKRDSRMGYASISVLTHLLNGYIVYFPENAVTKQIMLLVMDNLEKYSQLISLAQGMVTDQKLRSAAEAFSNCFLKANKRVLGFPDQVSAVNFSQQLNFEYNTTWGIIHFVDTTGPRLRYSIISHMGTSASIVSLYLQDLVENAMVTMLTKQRPLIALHHTLMPVKCYQEATVYVWLRGLLSMLFCLSFLVVTSTFVGQMLVERSERLHEFLLISGVSEFQLKLSWYLYGLFLYIPVGVLLALPVRFLPNDLMTHTGLPVLVLVCISFSLSQLSLAFLLTTFMKKPQWTTISVGLVYFITHSVIALANLHTIGNSGRQLFRLRLCCLYCGTPVVLAISYLLSWEQTHEKFKWSNLAKSPLEGDEYHGVAESLFWITFDCGLYLLLSLIRNRLQIRPLLKRLVRKSRRPTHVTPSVSMATPEDVQDSEEGLEAEIRIRHLCKRYPHTKDAAVENLCLNFYKGQITSLLGRNGAGKTTTLGVLTGLILPSSGTVLISGNDVRRKLATVRRNLGLCPQHDILYSQLTVREHIVLFGALKGLTETQAIAFAEPLLKAMQLSEAEHRLSSKLSGGMKRKLSVLISFLGNPAVIILDEPTSAIDAFSRRAIWDLILSWRMKATIVISTHQMQEADVLSDRVAILEGGRLTAAGSPLYLKTRYGNGCRLTVSHASAAAASGAQLLNAVQGKIPSAVLLETKGTDSQFLIPSVEPLTISELLQELQLRSDEFGLNACGVSESTLDEVFLKLATSSPSKTAASFDAINPVTQLSTVETAGEQLVKTTCFASSTPMTAEATAKDQDQTYRYRANESAKIDKNRPQLYSTNSGIELYRQQFHAVLIKRFTIARRSVLSIVFQFVCPILCVAIMLVVMRSRRGGSPSVLYSTPAKPVNVWLKAEELQPTVFMGNDDAPRIEASVAAKFSDLFSTALISDGLVPRFCDPVLGPCKPLSSAFKDRNEATSFVKNLTSIVNVSLPVDCQCGQSCAHLLPAVANTTLPTGELFLNLNGLPLARYLLYKTSLASFAGGFKLDSTWLSYPFLSGLEHQQQKQQKPSTSFKSNGSFSFSFDAASQRIPEVTIFAGKQRPILVSMRSPEQSDFMNQAVLNAYNNVLLRALTSSGYSGSTLADNQEKSATKNKIEGIFLETQEAVLVKSEPSIMYFLTAINMAFFLSLALTLTTYPTLLVLVPERSRQNKSLQVLSGLSKLVYWSANFTWDVTMYVISVFLVTGFFALVRHEFGNLSIPALMVISIFHVIGLLFLNYILTFMFKTARNAIIFIYVFQQLTNTVGFVLLLFSDRPWYDDARLSLAFLPFYFCTDSIGTLVLNQLLWPDDTDFYSWDLLGQRFFEHSCFMVASVLTVTMLEAGMFSKECLAGTRLYSCFAGTSEQVLKASREKWYAVLDAGVAAEQQKVKRYFDEKENQKQNLIVNDISKVYWRSKIAVSGVSFAVEPGQCFGLLGVNGAGKSTLFKMLTKKFRATQGDAFIVGKNISKCTVLNVVGYCPQDDVLFDLLTVEEHLEHYARIRGIASHRIYEIVADAIDAAGLRAHAKKLSKVLSGGNKRKLCFAVALLNCPTVLLLDEPTTGMDPLARQMAWRCLKDATRRGCSAVITSHSMEECELMADKVAIMTAGQFACIGSHQELKAKFGKTYKLRLQLNRNSAAAGHVAGDDIRGRGDALFQYVANLFPGTKRTAQQFGMVELSIPQAQWSTTLAALFRCVSECQQMFNVTEYSVSQATLEDVFLNVVNEDTRSPHA